MNPLGKRYLGKVPNGLMDATDGGDLLPGKSAYAVNGRKIHELPNLESSNHLDPANGGEIAQRINEHNGWGSFLEG